MFFDEGGVSFKKVFNGCFKSRTVEDGRYEELGGNSIYRIPSHLLNSLYLLQTLSARGNKTKLMYTVNAFRAI